MIVVLSPEQDTPHEIEILKELFHEGLAYYHLRKPFKNLEEHSEFLNEIDSKFHSRIMTHHCHELIKEFNLKGLHLKENKRRTITDLKNYCSLYTSSKIAISSSFHTIEDLVQCTLNFEYQFLSPVFTSISKKGYIGKQFNVNHIHKKVIGLGGVTTNKLPIITELGFSGAAVLGTIWNSKTPVLNFKKLQQFYIV